MYLRLLPVRRLPMPHNPSGCYFADRFDHKAEHSKSGSGGVKFLRRLRWMGARKRSACPYHAQVDWKQIAASAEALLAEHGPDADPQAVSASIDLLALEGNDRLWLESLFYDPIIVPLGAESYLNGQHRGCALRFSGWPVAVVST